MSMNANDLFKAVKELDLTPIKTKLMHVESGEGWDLEKANAVEKEYRRFLCMMKQYPDEHIAPMVLVDTFWHYHILDTMKYAADCEQVFGYFLHHYPYVGLRGGDDEKVRLDSGERMRVLYEAMFGEAYPGSTAANYAPEFAAGSSGIIFARDKGLKPAYCAGPEAATAYCAGPEVAAAYCAGPVPTTAYCAGPEVAAAFCASPGAAAAYCAGPEAAGRHASTAGSSRQARTALAA